MLGSGAERARAHRAVRPRSPIPAPLGERLAPALVAVAAALAVSGPARALPPAALAPAGLLAGQPGAKASARAARIRGFAESWLGTPYMWGGTTRSGIDCSAFLRELYRTLFSLELPRTTRDQIGLGVDLDLDGRDLGRGLEPGDVIFYIDTLGVPNHVVVYAGRDTIAHSTSGRGVVIEPIARLRGRRVVARRFLFPGGGDRADGGFRPIPPAGPIVPREVPCPADLRPRPGEPARYAREKVDVKRLIPGRDLCDFRALAEALRANGGPVATANAAALDDYVKWVQDIDSLQQDHLSPGGGRSPR